MCNRATQQDVSKRQQDMDIRARVLSQAHSLFIRSDHATGITMAAVLKDVHQHVYGLSTEGMSDDEVYKYRLRVINATSHAESLKYLEKDYIPPSDYKEVLAFAKEMTGYIENGTFMNDLPPVV